MALAQVHCFDHRTLERFVVSGDLWKGVSPWMMGLASCDHYRSRLVYADQCEKWIDSNLIVNLIAVEKIVCHDNVVYQERLYALPSLVVALLVAFDKLRSLQKQCQDWREQSAINLKAHEAALFQMSEMAVILADEKAGINLRKVMHAATQVSQLLLDQCSAVHVEAAACEFDEQMFAFEDFINELCASFADRA